MNLSYPNKRVALRAAEAMGKKHGVHFSVYKCAWCDGWHIYNSNEGIETLNHEVIILDEGIISGEQKGFLYSLMIGMVTCFTLYS